MTMMTSKDGAISRMQINDTKAGMGNIDKEKINAIILKSSQSKFRHVLTLLVVVLVVTYYNFSIQRQIRNST